MANKPTTKEVLTRGVAQILPSKDGLAKLVAKKKIKLYQGFDPSMPSLHLGNYVGLLKLRQFQRLGHKVIFLVGDFSGMIGDPTDKSATRPKLTREQTITNAKAWKEQASKVLAFEGSNPAEIKFNSAWLDKTTFKDLIEITSNFTVQQMIERDMFQKRLKEDKPIHLHEFLYPIATAIDCIEMDVDLEIGGNDQLFNMLLGRTLMKAVKGKEKFVLSTKLLVDKEGNKVGKTTGNALFLDSHPNAFFAGIMAFPDEVIALGFEILTEVDLAGIEEKVNQNPMKEKKRLAHEVVAILWGKSAADEAQNNFEKTFQGREVPKELEEVTVQSDKLALLDALFDCKLVSSRSEAKRLIKDGAVDVSGKTITDPQEEISITKSGVVVKIGKRRFAKIKTK